MAYTIQNSIDFAKSFINGMPLSAWANNEPAITIANTVQQTVSGAPFKWAWNRTENTGTSTVIGTQDYTFSVTDFGFLETVSLTDTAGKTWQLRDIYNSKPLVKASTDTNSLTRPASASVLSVNYGTNFVLRFSSAPDAIYAISFEYQKRIVPMSALTGGSGTWTVPDSMIDVFNTMFLAEAFQVEDDARAAQYRQRGAAALIARAEGLTEMDVNNFLAQYLSSDAQAAAMSLKIQQSVSARGI